MNYATAKAFDPLRDGIAADNALVYETSHRDRVTQVFDSYICAVGRYENALWNYAALGRAPGLESWTGKSARPT